MMPTAAHAALQDTLGAHLDLSKSRLVTLATLVIALASARTVNLSHAAAQFGGSARHASNYRRLQRFFQYVRFDQAMIARLIVRMLTFERARDLALDRTNWTLGRSEVNILTLALVTRRFRVPLFFTLLDHRGNSTSEQRIALVKRYLAVFDASSIRVLLADREFCGEGWMQFLQEQSIPFVIRMRQDLRVVPLGTENRWRIDSLLRRPRKRQTFEAKLPETGTPISIAAKRLRDGEWLIVAHNTGRGERALNTYRRRWGIECLFADLKRRGFNLEDTRLADPEKLATLLGVLILALVWAYRCATDLMGKKAIKRKAHGRREKSWFRLGLDTLRRWLFNEPENAASAWLRTCPKPKANQ
ncbi:IS4 family transposase [Jiella pelagia]|uniref:IS4 family transposase n=1 Tax=Jiella pelagia TaxID=2986949 RepID=A0ABY7BW20_9HYPH|nr:IS4 family transposase [Jiella pelagia]WAP68024.1 IS4 family transposase [Jiella pelagia]